MSGNSQAESAARVLENLAELEPELVNAGIFDQDLNPVFVTSESDRWADQATGLLRALEAGSGEEKPASAHVASDGGEVFAVCESGLWLVAVTGRFVLASLTTYDMRMALRDVARVGPGPEVIKAAAEAKNEVSGDA